MDVLGDSDPITQLSRQISLTLDGHDGGTVLGALAMSLSLTILWTGHKSGPLPTELRELNDSLVGLIVFIVRTRSTQRES